MNISWRVGYLTVTLVLLVCQYGREFYHAKTKGTGNYEKATSDAFTIATTSGILYFCALRDVQ